MESRDWAGFGAAVAVVGLIATACAVATPSGVGSGIVDSAGQANYQAALPIKAPNPRSLLIPKIGVNATPVVPLGLNKDGTHAVPPVNKPEQVGWYEPGPEPGDKGPAILLGHVNGGGHKGVFGDLTKLSVGDDVYVDDKIFSVTKTQTVKKNCNGEPAGCVDYADIADSIYNDTPGPEIRLITCGGDFNSTARSYEDNIVVFGKLKVSLP